MINAVFQEKAGCLVLVFVMLTIGLPTGTALAGDVNWTLSSQEWQNFNTPSAWNNSIGPAEGDWANIGVNAGQISKVKIDTVLPQLKRICLSTAAGTTTTVEIATGGKVVLTNDWNRMLQLNANREASGYDACSELRVTGGTIEFSDDSDASKQIRGALGVGSSIRAAGEAKVVMTAGRMLFGNGVNVGRADNATRASYEQSGGRLEFEAGGNGFTVQANGSVAVTGGEVVMVGTSCNNYFNGPALFKNCLFEFGSIAIANLERDPEGPKAFVIDEGSVVTGKVSASYLRINDGLVRMKGGFFSSYNGSTGGQIQFNGGAGQVAHFQMDDGFCQIAELNVANKAGGVGRYVQTGGMLMGSTYLKADQPQAEPACVEISGGTFSFSRHWSYCYPLIDNRCTNSLTFCIRGTPDLVEFLHAQKIANGSTTYTNRMHHLFQIDPRGLTPLTLNNTSSGSGAADAGRFAAHCSVHPWGGAQLIATNAFALVHGTTSITDYNDAADYVFSFRLARPDKRLWNWQYLQEGSYSDRNLGVTLTNTAAVAQGFRSVEGVPCGYFEIPRIRLGSTRRVSVRLGIVPKNGNTLADIVAELNAKSGCKAVAETADDCNVRVDLPLERLGDRNADRKFLFDFTREESPKAFERGEIVTDAVVTALEYERMGTGLMLILR